MVPRTSVIPVVMIGVRIAIGIIATSIVAVTIAMSIVVTGMLAG
jgi:hypothetical protein